MRRLGAALLLLCLAATTATADPAERKARSIQQLQSEGVPVLLSLPPVASEAEALHRMETEVVERMLGAMITAVKAETNDDDLIAKIIDQYGAAEFFTPDERAFLADPNPSQAERAKFGWRYEGVLVLMWAVGLEDMSRPTRIVDVGLMASAMSGLGTEGLMAGAKMRPQAEILDMLDLTYRYHWAVVDARIHGRPTPGGLDSGVVYERHRALNWLTGYQGQSWDDISNDT